MAHSEDTMAEAAETSLRELVLPDGAAFQDTASLHVASEFDDLLSSQEVPQEVLKRSKPRETEQVAPKPVHLGLDPLKQAANPPPLPEAAQPQAVLKGLGAPLDLEVELSFLLGSQLISLAEIKSLVEGKVISLGGSQFEVSILLQEKVIAHARLVLVDGVPSLQITKTVTL